MQSFWFINFNRKLSILYFGPWYINKEIKNHRNQRQGYLMETINSANHIEYKRVYTDHIWKHKGHTIIWTKSKQCCAKMNTYFSFCCKKNKKQTYLFQVEIYLSMSSNKHSRYVFLLLERGVSSGHSSISFPYTSLQVRALNYIVK